MTLDYGSLLIALAVSAGCLAATMFGSWFGRRTETFLLSCTFALLLIVSGIVMSGLYIDRPERWLGVVACVLFHSAFAMGWGAGYQFRTGRFPALATAAWATAAMLLSVPPMIAGYDGASFIAENTMIAAALFAIAYQYWLARNEAPAPLTAIALLYSATAVSFALCAAVLIAGGRLVLGAAPKNWAEDLSLAVCIASMTGIGALSLALQQWRIAARHRLDAITDPLTGLLNRRALFDRYGTGAMDTTTAIVVFDIDHFKAINDTYGHGVGDHVLKLFAALLEANCRTGDIAARLGGEEFALVLREMMPGRAEVVAERIRRTLEDYETRLDGSVIRCTVSAGVAVGRPIPTHFDAMLSAADKALYAAKRTGRNRIELSGHLHAVPVETVRTGS
jgi:diguanylate cyclase (GGDEF)-like protein